MSDAERPRPPSLEPLELHSGMVFGPRRTPLPPDDRLRSGSSIQEVLDELVLEALDRPPCLVAFSGGRDSSTILAVATRLARRHGLDDPVPITYRFGEHPRSLEDEWQEMMLRHLGLEHREVLADTTHMDALGPSARQALEWHGPYWPANAHSLLPLLQAAGGGSLVTGNGGDEVFSLGAATPSWSRMVRVLPLRQALAHTAYSLMPIPLRVRARNRHAMPWLRRGAKREVLRRLARKQEGDSTGTHPLQSLNESRYLELGRAIFQTMARETGARLVQPFMHPRFLGTVMEARPEGFSGRARALRILFGDLLPEAVSERGTKATFTEVLWGRHSRDFARGWDGTGLDDSLVDPGAVRTEWSKPRPDFRSVNPLHGAWIATGCSTETHT